MSQVDQGLSEGEQMHSGRSLIQETISSSRISNVLMGIVISQASKLPHSRLRIRIGEHTDLHVRRQALSTHGTVISGKRSPSPFPRKPCTLNPAAFGVENND
jgi:hypothetical protein